MKVHYFQHVPFEGLGSIEPWLKATSTQISVTRFYEDTSLPDINEIDWLIVMGGPMSVNDEHLYPWLQAEKKFIAQAISNGKIVLGVCLGAQLIANALGAKVFPNKYREIGWLPIQKNSAIVQSPFTNIIPSTINAFHWHGETFDLPKNGVLLAQSEACKNQAFSIGKHVLGLQFHLETTEESIKSLIAQCRSDIIPGTYVQSELEMLSKSNQVKHANDIMDTILKFLLEKPNLI
jgi:GMP synthase-like glutamine amidotransferase